jgi:hypothetical protein
MLSKLTLTFCSGQATLQYNSRMDQQGSQIGNTLHIFENYPRYGAPSRR